MPECYVTTIPARPAETVLHIVQCWFCGKKWAPSPLPAHDRVVVDEGFCPSPCSMQHEFFGQRRDNSPSPVEGGQ